MKGSDACHYVIKHTKEAEGVNALLNVLICYIGTLESDASEIVSLYKSIRAWIMNMIIDGFN